MKKIIIAALFLLSTTAFAQEQPKCGGQVYDPAEWECVGNNTLKELGNKDVWDAMGEGVNQIGNTISDGATSVWNKVKFW